jgi:hypothetical protein
MKRHTSFWMMCSRSNCNRYQCGFRLQESKPLSVWAGEEIFERGIGGKNGRRAGCDFQPAAILGSAARNFRRAGQHGPELAWQAGALEPMLTPPPKSLRKSAHTMPWNSPTSFINTTLQSTCTIAL